MKVTPITFVQRMRPLTGNRSKSNFLSSRLLFSLVLTGVVLGCAPPTPALIDRQEAEKDPDFIAQGEYMGAMGDTVLALQLAAMGDGEFRGLLYQGGFPGTGWDSAAPLEITAQRGDNDAVILRGEAVQGRIDEGVVRLEWGAGTAQLEKVERTSPSMGAAPPADAIVLFDGTNLEKWDENTAMSDEGLLKQGARTADEYGDMFLHMEFKVGFMPTAREQRRSNSGVYIQNRYEVQILDSFAELPTRNGNGSFYRAREPQINMTYPPIHWQTYEISFRAPRFDDDGDKIENARFTVYHNGVKIHDDVELESGTGAGGRREEVAEAMLYLQAHGSGGQARFRNIWLVEDADWRPAATAQDL